MNETSVFMVGLLGFSLAASAATNTVVAGFGTLTKDSGMSIADIDGDWHTRTTDWAGGPSAAVMTFTSLSMVADAKSMREYEAPVVRFVDNTGGTFSGDKLTLSFDYDTTAGTPSLYAHLKGFNATGVSPAWSISEAARAGAAFDINVTDGDVYNLFDGVGGGGGAAAEAYNGGLTGSGTVTTTIDLSGYAVSGLADYEYLAVAFAWDFPAAGAIEVSNLSLTAVSEPPAATTTILDGFGTVTKDDGLISLSEAGGWYAGGTDDGDHVGVMSATSWTVDGSLGVDKTREGAMGQIIDNTTGTIRGDELRMAFDYTTTGSGSPTIHVHLRGWNSTGESPNWELSLSARNGGMWNNLTFVDGVAYDLWDGASYALGSGGTTQTILSGSGRFSQTIDLSGYELENIWEYEYLAVGFQVDWPVGNNDPVDDVVRISNFTLEVVPDPPADFYIGDAASEERLVTRGGGTQADAANVLTCIQHTGSPTIYTAPSDQNLTLKEVNFFADTSGTLTPFVARYLGGDTQLASSYEILSIGDPVTVTSSDEVLGASDGDHLENRAFTVRSLHPTIRVNAGEMIAAGWLQDGHIVIQDATATQGAADYVADGDTLSGATVGGAPAGNNTHAYDRTMRFNIGFDITPGSIPEVAISSPTADSTFVWGDSIPFAAVVTDVEDDDATLEAGLVWFSDLESGVIGTGASFSTNSLRTGTHTITAYSSDSDSNVGLDAITIQVNGRLRELNHILGTGQSLSVGANGSPSLSTNQPYDNLMLSGGFLQTGTDLIPLVEGLTQWDIPVETISSALGNTLTALSPQTNYTSIVTRHGWGGRTYDQLKQGSTYYATGMDQVRNALAAAQIRGDIYRGVVAVTTVHGESDHLEGNGAYYSDYLLEWQSDYNADVKALTGQTNDIPMFLCQMSSYTKYNSTTSLIPSAQLWAAENSTMHTLVCPKYFLTYSDGIHLTAQSYRHLGEYYGKVLKHVLVDEESWQPLLPTRITLDGTNLVVDFHVPAPPLVLDTNAVLAQTDYGFEYADDASSAAIQSVTVTDADTITIALTAIPSGANPRLRYAHTGIAGSWAGWDQPGSARGNVRDSDATPSLYGNPLHNWLVHFDHPVPFDPARDDFDDDEISDRWENLNFGGTNTANGAGSNADGDSMSDYAE
jgi:hypothetical protein